MKYRQPVFFSDELTPPDDVDLLFSQLEQLEPPRSVVLRILHHAPTNAPELPLLSPSISKCQLDGMANKSRRSKS